MPGVVVGGRAEHVPGLAVRSWLDDRRIRLGPDDRGVRTERVQLVVLHTTQGQPTPGTGGRVAVVPGRGPRGEVERYASSWLGSSRDAGAHLVVDFDGSVGCLADLQREMAYHATTVHGRSIGIEIAQRARDHAIYSAQLVAVRRLCDWLSLRFGIQRQVHWPYRGPVARLAAGGADCVGFVGHRDQTDNKGPSDPGDTVLAALVGGGYQPLDFSRDEDLVVWRARQADLVRRGLLARADGVPGPATVAALASAGYGAGLWCSGYSPLVQFLASARRAVHAG